MLAARRLVLVDAKAPGVAIESRVARGVCGWGQVVGVGFLSTTGIGTEAEQMVRER